MIVALLIAAGAVTHAAWNLVVKRAALSGPGFVWLTALGAAIVTAPFAVARAIDDPQPWLHLLLAAGVSGAIHLGYFLSLQAGYRAGDVGVVYPLARGTGPLLTVIVAVGVWGERPGLVALAGAAAVIAGVVIIGTAGGRAGWSNARAGVLWGLLTGIAIAAYTLWDAHAITDWGVDPVILSGATFAIEAVLLAPIALRTSQSRAGIRSMLRTHRLEVATVSVLSPLSYILILIAITMAPVSIVAPAREASVVLVGLAGWLLFKEPHPARRLIGAAIVLVGVALLAAPA